MVMVEVFAYPGKLGRQGKLDWELGGMLVCSNIYSYFLNCLLCRPAEASGPQVKKHCPAYSGKTFLCR